MSGLRLPARDRARHRAISDGDDEGLTRGKRVDLGIEIGRHDRRVEPVLLALELDLVALQDRDDLVDRFGLLDLRGDARIRWSEILNLIQVPGLAIGEHARMARDKGPDLSVRRQLRSVETASGEHA